MSGRGREREVDGYLTRVYDRPELMVQDQVEVVIGRRTERGLLVQRVEPTAVDFRPGRGQQTDPLSPEEKHVAWALCQRLIPPGEFSGYTSFLPMERDPVSYRVPRDQARALGLALIEWAGGLPEEPAPSEPERLVALLAESLGIERGRVDRLLDAALPPRVEVRGPE